MTNEHGTLQLGQFNLSKSFDYPKPVELVERCIQLGTKPESIVLDSFAGSGTTAHAVLNLNKADGGLRKFILIEMGEYAEDITAKRVKNLISGYKSTKKISTTLHKHKLTVDTVRSGSALKKADSIIEKEKNNYKEVNLKIEDGVLYVSGIVEKDGFVPGLNGDFTYYELGKPVLKDDRTLNEDIPVAKIHSYIWHTETHTPYNKPENENPAYLGEYNHTAYYFHYKKEELTALDYDFLAGINIKADSYVIYADTCLLSQEELSAYNITFKKIPRDITKI